MSLIIRIDVDRPYGKRGLIRHIASRFSSDYYLPRLTCFGYLGELARVLEILNSREKAAHVFFRKCTAPSEHIRRLMEQGGHIFGLHLENSRSYDTFCDELRFMETHVRMPITMFSKHGSGLKKFGRNHYAPYEPEKYVDWAKHANLQVFFGNGEDPAVPSNRDANLLYYPAAFWLEPAWRDTQAYPLSWLLREARRRDVVMLLHPDNIVVDRFLMSQFLVAVDQLPVALAIDSKQSCVRDTWR